LVVLTGVVLVVSRLVVFEATNEYRAASVGFGTVPWLLGVGFPVLGAAVLLTAPVAGRARPVVAGLLVGAAVSVMDQALTFVAYIADYGYVAGPGWWVAAVALLLLLVSAVRAAPAPDSWRAPAPRADWAAVLGLVVVLGGWAVWTSRFYPDEGLWVPSLAPAVLLAVGCLPLAVLLWDDAQRWAGLTAVTVYGAYLVATQVHLIVTDSTWTGVPDAVVASGSAVVMVGVCHLSQRLGRRSPSSSEAVRA